MPTVNQWHIATFFFKFGGLKWLKKMLGLFALLHLFAFAPLSSKNIPVFYIEIFLFSKFAFKITG